MTAIAFFDVDKTLLAVNSATLWIKREVRLGHLSKSAALRAGFWVGLYGLGFAKMEDVLGDAVSSLAGKSEREVILRTLAFWREEVRTTIRPGARAAVAEHKAKGDLVFLLTSSSNYLSAPISDELQLDGFLANRFIVEDGVFTGGFYEPLCFAHGKVAHARVAAEKLHIDLAECAFYTDSFSDLPMMDAVGAPYAVHPDPRLARLARARGWPILDWGA
jgi:HAD superfamily hydrolase (TIGR01490 family)